MAKMMAFVLCVLALVARISAFVAPTPLVSMSAASTVSKAALASFAPVALTSLPAFAESDIVSQLPTQLLSLEVQFGAYLAVLLGTFVPVSFLIVLYIQSESRKAGEASQK